MLILSLTVAALEGGYRYGAAEGAGGPLLTKLLAPVWARFIPARTWCVSHPVLVVVSALGVTTLLLVAIRYWLLFWHNHVKARLTGTFFFPEVAGFPAHPFALLDDVEGLFEGSPLAVSIPDGDTAIDMPELTPVDTVVSQSSDQEFHCLTVTLFLVGEVVAADRPVVAPKRVVPRPLR